MIEDKNVIKSVIDEIPLPDDLEEKVLWNIKINGSKRNVAGRRQRKNMQWFSTIVAASLMIVLTLTITVSSFGTGNDSVVDIFFEGKGERIAKNLMKTEEQSVEIDNYKITMIEALYDNHTHVGYCAFEIENTEGIVEATIRRGMCIDDRFGREKRFSFGLVGESQDGSKYNIEDFWDSHAEKKNGKLYLYYSFFTGDEQKNIHQSEYLDKIVLYDTWNDSGEEEYLYNGSYSFDLEMHTDMRSGSNGKLTADISPVAVKISDPYERGVSFVSVVLKNGERIYEDDIQYIYNASGEKIGETIVFDRIIDISEVEHIKIEEFEIYLRN